jgi:hypothetical protein
VNLSLAHTSNLACVADQFVKVFLGTPHRGSDKIGLADCVSNIFKLRMRSPNDKILEVLAPDAQVLERQRKAFASISYGMPTACVSEELKTAIGIVRLMSSLGRC